MKPGSGGGSGTGLAPFERHPASPDAIEDNAGELASKANTALEADETTRRAFDPAIDSWDGVCSAELRAAPEPIRRDAFQMSSHLTWAAVPLRYWASRVRTFNHKVDSIANGLHEQGPRYGATGENGKPPSQDTIDSAREAATAAARGEYYQAHSTYIIDGAATAVSMFRDGPTVENVKKAKEVDAIPADNGAFTIFPAYWHETNMQTEARRATQIARRIIDDPNYRPTNEELASLRHILDANKRDRVFSTAFLQALGAEGLTKLNGQLATLQMDDPNARHFGTFDKDRAELVGALQGSLGIALATATKNIRAGDTPAVREGYGLSDDWVKDLTKVGREQVEIGHGSLRTKVYGYQLLGVLLHGEHGANHSEFSPEFLDRVGGDMLAFERANNGEHGGLIWHDTPNPRGAMFYGLRLNWIDGYGADHPAGRDPMNGLMTALEGNPEAARQFLYHPDPSHHGRLTRLDYLLTDREWMTDVVDHPEYQRGINPDKYVSPGLDKFGNVLEKATSDHPDARSGKIVESIVYEITHDEQAKGLKNQEENPNWFERNILGESSQYETFQKTNLINPALRDSMAKIMKAYIGDVHHEMIGAGRPVLPSGDIDPVTPGVQTVGANLNQLDLTRFLGDLGKDEGARKTVMDAEIAYAGAAYDHYLASDLPAHEESQWVHTTANASGRVFGALDFGAAAMGHETAEKADADHNQGVDYRYRAVGGIVDIGVDAATKRVPVAGQIAGPFIDEIMNSAQESAQQDSTGKTNYDVGALRADGRQTASTLAEAAVYRHTPVDQLPDDLKQDGSAIPMSKWTDEQARAWERYVEQRTTGSAASDARSTGAEGYNSGYSTARNDLQHWDK